MIGEYVDFDAEICRRCSWPFGLYTAAENGRVVCGPCPLGELPQMTNCVEPVDGVLETQVLQACNTRHCRQTPGFLQVWHFTISQASDVVYHRLDYTLPALFQRASHPVDLGRNQPPGLAPGTVFEDEGAGSLLDTSVHHIDLVACQPGFHCTDHTYVWVLKLHAAEICRRRARGCGHRGISGGFFAGARPRYAWRVAGSEHQ